MASSLNMRLIAAEPEADNHDALCGAGTGRSGRSEILREFICSLEKEAQKTALGFGRNAVVRPAFSVAPIARVHFAGASLAARALRSTSTYHPRFPPSRRPHAGDGARSQSKFLTLPTAVAEIAYSRLRVRLHRRNERVVVNFTLAAIRQSSASRPAVAIRLRRVTNPPAIRLHGLRFDRRVGADHARGPLQNVGMESSDQEGRRERGGPIGPQSGGDGVRKQWNWH